MRVSERPAAGVLHLGPSHPSPPLFRTSIAPCRSARRGRRHHASAWRGGRCRRYGVSTGPRWAAHGRCFVLVTKVRGGFDGRFTSSARHDLHGLGWTTAPHAHHLVLSTLDRSPSKSGHTIWRAATRGGPEPPLRRRVESHAPLPHHGMRPLHPPALPARPPFHYHRPHPWYTHGQRPGSSPGRCHTCPLRPHPTGCGWRGLILRSGLCLSEGRVGAVPVAAS